VSKPAKKLTLDETLEAMEFAVKMRREEKMAFFRPYPKQAKFFALSGKKREVALIAANQYGKTDAGAFAATCHLTGLYPKWWQGRKWNRPTRGWIAGETSLVVRDVQQRKLCGEPGVDSAFGTGMIPKECFTDKPSLARGITDAYDTIQVRHASGGVSIGRFKSYEQGRTKFQAETLDWGWADEEPDEDLYAEFLTRIAEGGVLFSTFTPLKGRSKVVLRFTDEPSPDRGFVNATLEEAEHFSKEEKARRMAGYLAHERDARGRGVPLLGSGAVYPFGMDAIREAGIPPSYLPLQWTKLWGIDFGIDHPFAAVLSAWDKDNDCIHIIAAFRMSGVGASVTPINHAVAMKQIAAAVPVAWPHDGHQRDKGSGEELAVIYRGQGLSMLADHAAFESGGYSREAAVLEITERAMSGRFKVAEHLSEWFSEFGFYHRKDGVIVRQNDDLMSATEKVIMAKRFGRPVPLGSKVKPRRLGLIAAGVDDEHFGM
jgi:phage terminase large subunit-like protein